MTRNLTLRQIAVGLILIMTVSLVLSTPAVGQAQSGTVTPQQNTSSANTTVVFENQTSNGSTVVIERATLPEGGFIALHAGGYAVGPAPADASIIATSEYLPAGSYTNVTVKVSNAPPGNYPGLNRSRLNESGTFAATLYRDTNDNQRFDFVRSFGQTDTAYTAEGEPVTDTAHIAVPSAEEERRIASVSFESQTLRNNTLVVESARLPEGGFLVALNASYQRTGDPLTSAVGISRYLAPGNYTNVPIRVLPGALNESQIVTVIPAQDTNGNRRYDYVRSQGFQDVAYVTANRSGIIAASAQVSVPSAEPTPTQSTQTQTASPQATSTSTPTETRSPAAENASGGSNESTGFLDSLGLVGVAVILALIAVSIIAIRRIL